MEVCSRCQKWGDCGLWLSGRLSPLPQGKVSAKSNWIISLLETLDHLPCHLRSSQRLRHKSMLLPCRQVSRRPPPTPTPLCSNPGPSCCLLTTQSSVLSQDLWGQFLCPPPSHSNCPPLISSDIPVVKLGSREQTTCSVSFLSKHSQIHVYSSGLMFSPWVLFSIELPHLEQSTYRRHSGSACGWWDGWTVPAPHPTKHWEWSHLRPGSSANTHTLSWEERIRRGESGKLQTPVHGVGRGQSTWPDRDGLSITSFYIKSS